MQKLGHFCCFIIATTTNTTLDMFRCFTDEYMLTNKNKTIPVPDTLNIIPEYISL